MDYNRIPILIGCGQVTQREPDPNLALGPLDLTAAAARQAAEDAGGGNALLSSLDTIVVIRSFSDTSWRFASPFGRASNPPKSIADRIGNSGAKRHIYTYPGGNMPQWCINRLGEKISAGEVDAALICGGEALATQRNARRAKVDLDWNEDAGGEPEQWGVATRGWNENEERHRMAGAIFAYPLFENAIRGHKGRSISEHLTAMGALFAGFSDIASRNPLADRRQGYSARQISTLSADNPFIGFPYTKLMNANAYIDQASSVILTSVAKAKALGISEDRWVYLHGCADAYDHWYISDRHNFHSSPAMRVVAQEALEMANIDISAIDKFDLYSCFPSSVEIACREMGIEEEDPRGLTVTGGLPYFGGPGNNYVTHAIAEMMNEVRKAPGSRGMITANGNYVTKQSVGIYSTDPTAQPFAPKDPVIYQQAINDHKGPDVAEIAHGLAQVETYTVMHDREGPSYAILFGQLQDGRRFIANTPEDPVLLQNMVDQDFLGVQGQVVNKDGQNIFTPV
ncbi:acetyl-CoA acetyltransferase [Sneathiella marina]|uniref:Acetyl-CoA acetyltransferase n=1 Tax=Sneathiella marina TaxID=2950108 RepID=A0ABY4W5R5_9PROT|nr:acetyl-CoA acetyltransferase [Sneathiella marina]USG62532.1 acetyl-CoA acetyltransferase [Sneathiella marina]